FLGELRHGRGRRVEIGAQPTRGALELVDGGALGLDDRELGVDRVELAARLCQVALDGTGPGVGVIRGAAGVGQLGLGGGADAGDRRLSGGEPGVVRSAQLGGARFGRLGLGTYGREGPRVEVYGIELLARARRFGDEC